MTRTHTTLPALGLAMAATAGLGLASSPASAEPIGPNSWVRSEGSWNKPKPYDSGGFDAETSMTWSNTIYMHGIFDAYSDRVHVDNYTNKAAKYSFKTSSGKTIDSGSIPAKGCARYGYSESGGCDRDSWGPDTNIAEGTIVDLEICVDTARGWACASGRGRT